MTTRLAIYTGQDAFEALHELADTKKTFVRIERQALINLLMDHSAMLNRMKACGVTVAEPEEKVA